MSETGEWLECIADKDYEIWNQYPYPLRRKGSDKVISECLRSSDGYACCKLNNITYQKHRIIAQQFIDNPNNLPFIDHINHNRADNRIENLRWCSSSENNKNKASNKGIVYDYFDEIPCENIDDIIEVRDYGRHIFEDLYYCNDCFYFFNGIQYRRLHINYKKNGSAYVQPYDNEGRNCCIYYSKFKRLYDLV